MRCAYLRETAPSEFATGAEGGDSCDGGEGEGGGEVTAGDVGRLTRQGLPLEDECIALRRRVATLVDGPQTSGAHAATWSPEASIASGVYVVRLRAGGTVQARRVTVVR